MKRSIQRPFSSTLLRLAKSSGNVYFNKVLLLCMILSIVCSARVMRDESGRSRGFGFVSFQTPDQASTAMHSMNGVVLGSKQIVVRLHEPKHLRQEKLAQRFAGGHNNHPRSRSGATSPTASEGGESLSGFPSPRGSYMGLASPSAYSSSLALTSERARRSSGSYYNVSLELCLFLCFL